MKVLTMKHKRTYTLLAVLLLSLTVLQAQETRWTLQQCLDHARQNNLQIQKAQLDIQSSKAMEKQAKAALLPSINANISQGASWQKVAQNDMTVYASENSLSGRYSLSAGLTLFNGNKNFYNIKSQKLNTTLQQQNLALTQRDIEIEIVQAYLEILYATESLASAQQTLQNSKSQVEQAQAKVEAGSISQSDYATFVAQYAEDNYKVINAQNTLDQANLVLKQLLELDINQSIQIDVPQLTKEDIIRPLSDKQTIYNYALQNFPEAKINQINQQIANLEYKTAKAGYYPTLSLSASVGTGNWYDSDISFGSQLNNNLNENISLSLNIPILDNRQTRTSVDKAKINRQMVALNNTTTEKNLLKTLENLYQQTLAAQNKYLAAQENLKATEESYRLVQEKFNLGMKNTVELLSEKTKYLNAQQNTLQAKYTAALNLKLLNYYQGIPLE